MKILVWIIQVLVAFVFFGAGLMKLFTPYAELLADPNTAWAGDFSATQIIIISLLEVLGALGLIIPMFVTKLRVLVPIAAIGLALTMVGALITHLGRDESITINIILFALAAYIVWSRSGFFKSQK